MKKSSILVTLFLVVALIFAVSCPSGVAVNIDKEVSENATVGVEKTFTFEVSTTGEFLSTAVDQPVTVTGYKVFDASDKKASASAKISKLGVADTTTKKITTATISVTLTAQKAQNEAKELTFAIPAVESGKTATILKDVTSEVNITGKKVLVTASNPTKDVTVTPTTASTEITAGSTNEVTLDFTIGPEGATVKENAKFPNIATSNNVSFNLTRKDANTITLHIKPASTAVAGTPTPCEFTITSAFIDIASGSSVIIPDNLKVTVNVTVKAAAAKTDITAPTSSKSDAFSFAKASQITSSSITYTLSEGATWKDNITTITYEDSKTLTEGITVTPSIDSTKKVLTLTFSGTPTVSATSEIKYEFKIDNLIDLDSTHKIPDAGIKCSFSVTVSES